MFGLHPIGVYPISVRGVKVILDPIDKIIADKVTADFPSKLEAAETNYDHDAFKDNTSSGRCLEFFNGKLYFAINNYVYCTKTFDMEHIDVRYSVVAGFPEEVTMIARVNDGLFVATAKNLYFLKGMTPEIEHGGFEQKHVAKFGAIYNTNVRYQQDLVQDSKGENTVVIWANDLGVWAGSNGGAYTCLSLNQISMPTGSVGAAMITERNGIYQYVVTYQDLATTGSNTFQSDILNDPSRSETIVLNLVNGCHSRYTNFLFNSYFKFGEKWYGTKATGLYELSGNSDGDQAGNSLPIDAFAKTPITDFEEANNKQLHDAFINARASGTMKLDITIDENDVCNGLDIVFDAEEGKHRRRAKIPQGLKGNSWQFTIRNNNGAYFKLFDFEVNARTLKRTI